MNDMLIGVNKPAIAPPQPPRQIALIFDSSVIEAAIGDSSTHGMYCSDNLNTTHIMLNTIFS